MKNIFAAVCLGLAALLLASCPSPSGPSPTPTSNYISFSINGGTATTYTSGVTSGSSRLAVTTPGLPLASIPGTSYSYFILYASKSIADFEAAGVDSIFISIILPVATPPSIGAGSHLNASGEGANISLRVGTRYIAWGVDYKQIDLTLDQSVDNTSSIGKTVTGTFSGTITSDGGTTTASISGSFNLIYQTTTGTVS